MCPKSLEIIFEDKEENSELSVELSIPNFPEEEDDLCIAYTAENRYLYWIRYRLLCIECRQIIIPPIVVLACNNSHYVCKECSFDLNWCQVCNVEVRQNGILDVHLGCINIKTSCRNRTCPEAVLYCMISSHARLCLHQLFRCPLRTPYEYCRWEGCKSAIHDHILSDHKNIMVVYRHGDECNVNFRLMPCTMVIIRPQFNEVFALKIYFTGDINSRVLSFVVKYVGPLYYNPVYRYELFLGTAQLTHLSNQSLDEEIGQGLSMNVSVSDLVKYCRSANLDDVHDIRFTLKIQLEPSHYLLSP